jgi:hypothetical protein
VLLLSGMLVLAPSTIENYGKVRCEVFQGEGKPLAWFLSSRWVQHDGPGTRTSCGDNIHGSGDSC